MARTPEEALTIDHDLAKMHALFYITEILTQVAKRSLILNGAIQEFNKFLSLPESSSRESAIWDLALGIVSMAVPALKLGAFIKTAHWRAENALKQSLLTATQPRLADQAKKVVTGAAIEGTKAGEKAKDYYDKFKTLAEKAGKLKAPEMPAVEHQSRKPIFELIQDLDAAKQLWETAVRAEMQEWINRVDDLPPQPGTLVEMIHHLLPDLPASFSEDELKEIWTLYLWTMVGEYCRKNVKWKTTVDRTSGSRRHKLEGLNDTQQGQILKWFGADAKRGKIFNKPTIWGSVGMFFAYFPIQEDIVMGGDDPNDTHAWAWRI